MRVVIAEDHFLLRDGLTRLLAIAQRLVITGRAVAKHTLPSSSGSACIPPTTTTGGYWPSSRSSAAVMSSRPAGSLMRLTC